MAVFILNYEFKDGGYAELDGQDVKYWAGEGLVTYEGGLDGFAELYPRCIDELITKKLLSRK